MSVKAVKMIEVTIRTFSETTETFHSAECIADELEGFVGVKYWPETGEKETKYFRAEHVKEIKIKPVN